MTKYLIKRILYSIFSIVVVVAIVMVLIYSLMDRQLIFAQDPTYTNLGNNAKVAYQYRRWEEFGYIDYVPYSEWIADLARSGQITEEERSAVTSIGRKPEKDSPETAEYVAKFYEYFESRGYAVRRLDAVMATTRKVANGGNQQLFAYKDKPLSGRLIKYFTGFISVDNIHFASGDVGERGLTFTLHDPVYGGEKFAPAIIGNGTQHKYLLYTDSRFPFLHQNLVSVNLGKSYTVNQGVDVAETMSTPQGSYVTSLVTYPTGHTELSADDLHSARYIEGSREASAVTRDRFVDDYTNVITVKSGLSKIGYSFVIGIIASLMAYVLAVPLGIIMSRHKDKLIDKIGTIYIVFILAVPSLAYIFLFKAIGYKLGLPTTFDMEHATRVMYILPIVSLALPSIANLMKWLRRFMIDQMNADYVKFARSGGLSENEIFSRHILKNAAIPLIHGIPASILGALVGAIITERVYVVPGAGNLLTKAINFYDNGVIVGVTLFYAVLSVTSIILGDVLMSMVDPRISFSSKAR
ncbi:MAG: ABC transporter permease [Oscillospiraceae bacterium]|nr:ABC transporter permease [Oscillospiraceae bacterium]